MAEDEVLAKLPYTDKPAEMWDVLHELTNVVAMISAIVSVSPRTAMSQIKDGTKEPGQSILIAQTRLGIALESWAGTSGQDVIEALGETLPKVLSESFIALHHEAHHG